MLGWAQIVSEFITAVFTDGDLSAVDRYLDPGFVNHDPPFPGAPDGPAGMRMAGEIFRRAFPDWRSDVQQLIAEGDLVAENFIAHGTHAPRSWVKLPPAATSFCAG